MDIWHYINACYKKEMARLDKFFIAYLMIGIWSLGADIYLKKRQINKWFNTWEGGFKSKHNWDYSNDVFLKNVSTSQSDSFEISRWFPEMLRCQFNFHHILSLWNLLGRHSGAISCQFKASCRLITQELELRST